MVSPHHFVTKHFATAVTADSGTPTAGTPSREDSRQRSPAVMKFSDDSSKVVGRQLSGSSRQLKVRIENSRQREILRWTGSPPLATEQWQRGGKQGATCQQHLPVSQPSPSCTPCSSPHIGQDASD
ncbi:hypothetical protein Bbelb_284470 [Branchiostoma belcheri]|nr:hypothetical protein Bbelb_284470 [Branchiostoma belcheri]